MKNKIMVSLVTIFIVTLMSFSVSAFTEWDNVFTDYNETTKTATIKNLWGFGKKIADIKLESELVQYVIPGKNRKVAEFTINSLQDYDRIFNDMKFYSGATEIQRNFTYKLKVIKGYRTIQNQESYDCDGNGENCKYRNTNKITEEIIDWVDFDYKLGFEKGNNTIGVFTDVYEGDYIEWIPTLFGEEIDQWAVWTASLNVNLIAYYNFDEGGGINLEDNWIGNNDGTLIDNVNWTTGKVGNSAVLFNQLGASINITPTPEIRNFTGKNTFGNYTITWWMNYTKTAGDATLFSRGDSAIGPSDLWAIDIVGVSDSVVRSVRQINQGSSGSSHAQWLGAQNSTFKNVWTFYAMTFARNGSTDLNLYVNGVLHARTDSVNTLNTDDLGIPDTIPFNISRRQAPAGNDFNGTLDEVGIWNRVLSASEITQIYNGGDGIAFNEDFNVLIVNVTLNNPPNALTTINTSLSFNGTFTTTNDSFISITGNLTNATLILWNSAGTELDRNTSSINGTSNSSTLFLSNIARGLNHEWNYEVCAINSTSTVCSRATTNRTINVTQLRKEESSFSNITTEGNLETFLQNLTLASGVSITQANLIYNGTSNTGESFIVGNKTTLRKTNLLIPDVASDVNLSFFWSVVFSDGSVFNLSSNNQTVLNISLDNCVAFSNQIFNFTVKDEELQTTISDATVEIAVNLFDINRQLSLLNFSGNFTNVNPTRICLNRNLTATSNYSVDVIVRYDHELYANEYFNIVDLTLQNNTPLQDITLFDLNISDTTDFQLTFTGSDFLPVENALVFIDRQYIAENVFKTVELPKTDSNGQTILHLVRNDVIYNIRILKGGVVLGSFQNQIAFCEDFVIGNCQITLNAFETTEEIFNYDSSLGIVFTAPTFDNNTGAVVFNFLTEDGSVKEVSMQVERSDTFGNRSLCNDSLSSSGGSLSCSIPTNIDAASIRIIVLVDGVQAVSSKFQIDPSNYGEAGFLVFFVMTLSFALIFSKSKTGILLSMLLSFGAGARLNMISSGFISFGATGIWLIIIVIIGIWKLNKERQQ